MSSMIEEDRSSVSSCFSLLGTALKVCTNSGGSDEDTILEQIELYINFGKKINMYTTLCYGSYSVLWLATEQLVCLNLIKLD